MLRASHDVGRVKGSFPDGLALPKIRFKSPSAYYIPGITLKKRAWVYLVKFLISIGPGATIDPMTFPRLENLSRCSKTSWSQERSGLS